MVVVFLRAVSTVAQGSRSRGAVPVIRCLDAGLETNRMEAELVLVLTGRATATEVKL
jgi:hypothetical protein